MRRGMLRGRDCALPHRVGGPPGYCVITACGRLCLLAKKINIPFGAGRPKVRLQGSRRSIWLAGFIGTFRYPCILAGQVTIGSGRALRRETTIPVNRRWEK